MSRAILVLLAVSACGGSVVTPPADANINVVETGDAAVGLEDAQAVDVPGIDVSDANDAGIIGEAGMCPLIGKQCDEADQPLVRCVDLSSYIVCDLSAGPPGVWKLESCPSIRPGTCAGSMCNVPGKCF